jgi:hypothetical protein
MVTRPVARGEHQDRSILLPGLRLRRAAVGELPPPFPQQLRLAGDRDLVGALTIDPVQFLVQLGAQVGGPADLDQGTFQLDDVLPGRRLPRLELEAARQPVLCEQLSGLLQACSKTDEPRIGLVLVGRDLGELQQQPARLG